MFIALLFVDVLAALGATGFFLAEAMARRPFSAFTMIALGLLVGGALGVIGGGLWLRKAGYADIANLLLASLAIPTVLVAVFITAQFAGLFG